MPHWTARCSPGQIVFRNGRLKLLWTRTGGTLGFAGMQVGRKTFRFGEGSRLWQVELRDRAGYRTLLSSADETGFSWKTGRRLTLAWTDLADGAVDVIATLRADAERPVARCRLRIVNRSRRQTVWSIGLPVLADVLGPSGSHRDDVLITPDGFGSAIPDPVRQPKLTCWTNRGYPNGLQALPFVALTNGGLGLYVGRHDPAAGLCRFHHLPNAFHDRLPIELWIEPEDAGRCQDEVAPDSEVVLGLFTGDWYDAAEIYRPWAIRQNWAARPVDRREDIPDWSRHTPLWVRLDFPNTPEVPRACMERLVDVCLRFRQAMGRDIAAHLYRWHDHPFDTQYPAYRPRPGVRAFIRRLQDNGIRVMPYINARLFDLDCPDWAADHARRAAVKDAAPKLGSRAQRLFVETYGSMTPMAVMCPATRYWQDKIAGVIERLVRDLEVDGVYADQVAAAPPEACSDPAHGHPLRGGGWWVDGYAQMVAEVRRRIDRLGRRGQVLLTTECNADPYLGMFGNFLMVHGKRNFVVPLFPAVYGGRAPLFAREADPAERMLFRITMAQNVLWSCQTGWFGPPAMEHLMSPEYRPEMEMLQGLCALYDRMRPYFGSGEMLRPPAMDGPLARTDLTWHFCGDWPETTATVWASRWRRRRRAAIAVVNAHVHPQDVDVRLDARERAGTARPWWGPNATGRAKLSRGRAEMHLPPGGIVMLEFA